MKTFLTTFLFAFIAVNNICYSQFQGSGTAEEPYQIWSRADMELLADSVNNGNYWSRGKHFRNSNRKIGY